MEKGKDWVFCPDCGAEYNRFGPGHECDQRILDAIKQEAQDDAEVRRLGHGGPGRGQGRHKELGYDKAVKMRFLSEAEEETIIKEFTPRQRVEILLAALSARKPNKKL